MEELKTEENELNNKEAKSKEVSSNEKLSSEGKNNSKIISSIIAFLFAIVVGVYFSIKMQLTKIQAQTKK